MTELLEHAIAAARKRTPNEQDELAHMLLAALGEDELYLLSDEEEALLNERRAAVERGELASEEDVDAVLAKYRI